MRGLLTLRKKKVQPPIKSVAPEFPTLRDAELAAAFAGQRFAGDYYDSFRVSPSRVLFGLLDIAGRREQNQNILSAAQRVFRELGMKLLSPADANESVAMTELCLQLNRTIMETAQGVHSSPAFAGCYNEDLGILCYFNSGHTPALVKHANDVSQLDATGLPLGLFSLSTSEARIIAMEPGAILALASRGVVEAECQGADFGLSGVEGALKNAELSGAPGVCRAILDEVQQFTCSRQNQDDLTALALVRSPAS
jgi:serine phosphatase RsbU (regulator of sigma subunit)